MALDGGGTVRILRQRLATQSVTLTSTQSAALKVGNGASILIMSWPAFSQKTTLKFLAADSNTGTYRIVRKSDDSGDLTVYGTSASAAGYVLLPDLAGTTDLKVRSSKNLTGSYKVLFMPRG